MPDIRFIPVDQIKDPLTISLGFSGGSGTGKTFSALRVARGMAQAVNGPGAKIGFVDTENRRALHYRETFPEMVHFDMKAVDDKGEMVGFGPERWIEVIDAAEAANLPVLVIDSFSHAWEGVGGVLDLHAQKLDQLTGGDETKRSARSQLAWAHVKPRYRRLVDRIVRANTNIIICTRAKPVMQEYKNGKEQNARKTKTRRPDVPWDPAADGDLMFEMTAMVILDPAHPGCPVYQIKVADQFKTLFDGRRPMGEALGQSMVEWARGAGDAAGEKEAMDAARDAARKGKAALEEFWNRARAEMPVNRKAAIRRIMESELVPLALDAEAAKVEDSDEIPFPEGGPAESSPADSLLAVIQGRIEDGADPRDVRDMFEAEIRGISENDPNFMRRVENVLSKRAA